MRSQSQRRVVWIGFPGGDGIGERGSILGGKSVIAPADQLSKLSISNAVLGEYLHRLPFDSFGLKSGGKVFDLLTDWSHFRDLGAEFFDLRLGLSSGFGYLAEPLIGNRLPRLRHGELGLLRFGGFVAHWMLSR
tara:strand:- start:2288 stop:2689 length:402 start_codon:yes stop_codon:yes gene_type:complete